MASNKVPGNIIGVRIGGVWLVCQTEATLNLTVNVSEEDPCKPEPGSAAASGTPWVSRSVDSRDWDISFSQTLMRNSLAASNPNMGKMIIDDLTDIEVEFMSATGQTKIDSDFIYSGSGILTGFTMNAPVTGSATTDSTVAGNGPLTYEEIPVTS